MSRKPEISYRPGTVGYYLRAAGYVPVLRANDFPLWQRGSAPPVEASVAMKEFWKRTRLELDYSPEADHAGQTEQEALWQLTT